MALPPEGATRAPIIASGAKRKKGLPAGKLQGINKFEKGRRLGHFAMHPPQIESPQKTGGPKGRLCRPPLREEEERTNPSS